MDIATIKALSQPIEQLLVRKNLRGMQHVLPALEPDNYWRAANILHNSQDNILIGTGFPVADTFETDGPVGAIALYNALKDIGKEPILVCGKPLYDALQKDFTCFELPVGDIATAPQFAQQTLALLTPSAIVSIERPGLSEQGRYFNMRGEDISPCCACFDFL